MSLSCLGCHLIVAEHQDYHWRGTWLCITSVLLHFQFIKIMFSNLLSWMYGFPLALLHADPGSCPGALDIFDAVILIFSF